LTVLSRQTVRFIETDCFIQSVNFQIIPHWLWSHVHHHIIGGRVFLGLGFKVSLIPAQHVKPFVGRQKNDANDARAICEAYSRPNIHFVPVKSIEQQDLKALRSVRSRLVEQRTGLANQIRGLTAEYGIVFPTSIKGIA